MDPLQRGGGRGLPDQAVNRSAARPISACRSAALARAERLFSTDRFESGTRGAAAQHPAGKIVTRLTMADRDRRPASRREHSVRRSGGFTEIASGSPLRLWATPNASSAFDGLCVKLQIKIRDRRRLYGGRRSLSRSRETGDGGFALAAGHPLSASSDSRDPLPAGLDPHGPGVGRNGSQTFMTCGRTVNSRAARRMVCPVVSTYEHPPTLRRLRM